MHQAEIAASDADDRCDGLDIRKISVIQVEAELSPALGEDEGQCLILQRFVRVDAENGDFCTLSCSE